MYLVGDIGGTKTNIAILELVSRKFVTRFEKNFISKDYDSLRTIVKKVFDEDIKSKFTIAGACFGVAGPVKDGLCDATNLPWLVDAKKIAEVLNFEANLVHLLNDLESAAYGIDVLEEKDVYVLNKGIPQKNGSRVLISAGTGLGESIIFWDGRKYKPSPSEGGHTDFAPRNKTEIDLLNYLINKYGRISYERILSGPGLLNVYSFFKDTAYQNMPPWLLERLKKEDPSAVISEVAMLKKDECCEKALELFVSVYGAEAGNLALTGLATGGVYIGGGIAPKILEKLKEGSFIQAFTHKGRLSVMVSQMPVKVILNDKIPLLGCGNYLNMHDQNRLEHIAS
ncbi:MAG: glucokinase [Candidatus Melainabacteria bacterium]|nr:glucokinase [Candidatus Melainabacteria bacterium]